MKFDRNKDGGEDEEDRVPAAEASRRRFFPPPGKTMMNEENALRTFREGGEGLGFKTATKKEQKQKRKAHLLGGHQNIIKLLLKKTQNMKDL